MDTLHVPDNVDSIVEAIKNTTSNAKRRLEEIEITGDEPLRFSISDQHKLDEMRQQLGLGDAGGGGTSERKFRASEEVLRKGIVGEVFAPNNNHYWFKIRLENVDNLSVTLTTEQNGGQCLGDSLCREVQSVNEIYLPGLICLIRYQRATAHLEFHAEAAVLIKQIKGLVLQENSDNGEVLVFERIGREAAEKAKLSPKMVSPDVIHRAEGFTLYTKELGDSFVSFSINSYGYCVVGDENGED